MRLSGGSGPSRSSVIFFSYLGMLICLLLILVALVNLRLSTLRLENAMWNPLEGQVSQVLRVSEQLARALERGDGGGAADYLTGLEEGLGILQMPHHRAYVEDLGQGGGLQMLQEQVDQIHQRFASARTAHEVQRQVALVDELTLDVQGFETRLTSGHHDYVHRLFLEQRQAGRWVIYAVAVICLLASAFAVQLVSSVRREENASKALRAHHKELEATVQERTEALHSALESERLNKEHYRSFISTVSHQFRTPLAVILMTSQRMTQRAEEFTASQVAQKAQRITANTQKLTELMRSVSHAVEVDRQSLTLVRVPVDMNDLILEVLAEMRRQSPARVFLYDPPRQEMICWCDRALMEQVIQNLLSNAVKYSPQNAPVVLHLEQEEGQINLRVSDEGIGIPAADLPHLFGRFFRASNTASIFGSGLGLYLSRHILELHKGTIAVQSVENFGSSFTLSLPMDSL